MGELQAWSRHYLLRHLPPIRVDFLAAEHLPLPGRLGLTIAPGRCCGPDEAAGPHLLVRDVGVLAEVYRAGTLVTLQEETELAALPAGDPRAEARRQGLESLWFPIVDGAAPSAPGEAAPVVEQVVSRLGAGQVVVVHCLGGLGRSGLLAACVLVRLGVDVAEAMARVRAARPGAIQTAVQERFIARYATWRARGKEAQP